MRTSKTWRDKLLPQVLDQLPLRLREDVKNIPTPDMTAPVKSLYIYGQVGSGKTVHATFMMLGEMKYRYINNVEGSSSSECTIRSIPELLFDFKHTYDKDSTVTEQELMGEYEYYHLLVLDDFGVEKISDWSYQLLYMLINRRYNNLKTTIFTSNFSLEQIAQQLGDDRLTSRIQHMCTVQKFEGDYRT